MCSTLYLCCSMCDEKQKFMTSKQTEKEAEINKLVTLAAVEVGLGREGMSDKISILNISSPVSVSNYANHVTKLLHASESAFAGQLSNARQRLRDEAVNDSNGQLDSESIIDVAVTYDGTWSKRGFTANRGIGVVISVDTGEVLANNTRVRKTKRNSKSGKLSKKRMACAK